MRRVDRALEPDAPGARHLILRREAQSAAAVAKGSQTVNDRQRRPGRVDGEARLRRGRVDVQHLVDRTDGKDVLAVVEGELLRALTRVPGVLVQLALEDEVCRRETVVGACECECGR